MVVEQINFNFKYDFTEFNKTMKAAAEAMRTFTRAFQKAQQNQVTNKKSRKANSRRLRYTLKAHSR